MKYFIRKVTRREAINRFGKIGYPSYFEYFKTNDEDFIRRANAGKRIRFEPVKREARFLHIEANKIYEEREETK